MHAPRCMVQRPEVGRSGARPRMSPSQSTWHSLGNERPTALAVGAVATVDCERRTRVRRALSMFYFTVLSFLIMSYVFSVLSSSSSSSSSTSAGIYMRRMSRAVLPCVRGGTGPLRCEWWPFE